jgi:hypothetical protein
MSWKPGIHKLDGVKLPLDIEYTLSVNLKYLFPVEYSQKVAEDWFEELCRKARIRTHFWQQGDNREEDAPNWTKSIPYLSTGWDTGIDDDWFADGVSAGRKALRHALHERPIPQTDVRDDALFRVTVPPKNLREWMLEAQLLAFITDKNLGIVVVTRSWYEKQIQAFLDMPCPSDNTRPLFEVEGRGKEAFDEFHRSCRYWLEAILLRTYEGGPIQPFLQSKRVQSFWRTAYSNTKIPIFHGIPKIHKNPWKIRPIVPMHSYVLGPLAKILHALLLPVQRSFYWICESSRNLCSEVASFNKRNATSTRFHSGDVTGMYTNIQWRYFGNALQALLEDGNWYDEQTRTWILSAAQRIWSSAMFQVGPYLVTQRDGVPMGLHCAPVFANLFMAYYERDFLNASPSLFYRRYIDDIFALDPSDETLDQLRVPGLTIPWTHSAHELSFLDVRFHTHPESAEVCFAPFYKALNHHQYIPWASSHPLSVKKGLVKGELSRVRAICYKESYFLAWKKTFMSWLRARGWPIRALHSWGRQVQWRAHFPGPGLEQREEVHAIMAVSKYNPVWDQVSSSAIWDSMRKAWLWRGPPDQPYPPRAIVAKKRGRSLWDASRAVNRIILHREIEEIDIEELSASVSTLDSEMSYQTPRPLLLPSNRGSQSSVSGSEHTL